MMEYFVDKLPKSCLDCKCCGGDYLNFLCNFTEDEVVNYDSICKNCPLQSLADHDKQVRKEVCEEIWKEFEQRLMNKTGDMSVINVAHLINSVLDQIQGEQYVKD